MNYKKLSDEEVEKALKCCGSCNGSSCKKCPCQSLGVNCEGVSLQALEVIVRLKTENKSLTSENNRLLDKLDEQEKLKDVQIDVIRAETVKDFSDRLHHTLAMNGDDSFEVWEIEDFCKDIIKEMTEE